MYRKIITPLLLLTTTLSYCPKPSEQGTMANVHSTMAHAEKTVGLMVGAIPVVADNTIKVLKEIPKTAGDTTYNVVAAPFRAGRDGIKTTAQTVVEHPYAFAGVLSGLGILGGVVHYAREYFPSREETTRRARLEHEAAEHKTQADSLTTETEFRTCLNKHFRCMEPGQRMPRQCHSPARRFSLLNRTKLDEMLDGLNKFKD